MGSISGKAVNVAARMESNSKSGRIQCSYDSAMMLRELNAYLDIVQRGKISIKGKGKFEVWFCFFPLTNDSIGDMTTFWIRPFNTLEKSSSFSSIDSMVIDTLPMPEAQKISNISTSRDSLEHRCIEILTKHLRNVVVYRKSPAPNDDVMAECEKFRSSPIQLLSNKRFETSVAIPLPEYDAKRIRAMKSKSSNVNLTTLVTEQLQAFVSSIAKLYRDNAFHNFEVGCFDHSVLLSHLFGPYSTLVMYWTRLTAC